MTTEPTTTTEQPTTDQPTEPTAPSSAEVVTVISLTADQAKRAAAISYAASSDTARASIAQVRVRIRPTISSGSAVVDATRPTAEVEVTATDSYIVASRVFGIDGMKPNDNNQTVSAVTLGALEVATSEHTISAKDWREALTSSAKAARYSDIVVLSFGRDVVTIKTGTTTTELRTNLHDFPNIDRILADNRPAVGENYNGRLPALSSALIGRLAKSTGYVPAKVPAFAWEVTTKQVDNDLPELQPTALALLTDPDWTALIMPVRR